MPWLVVFLVLLAVVGSWIGLLTVGACLMLGGLLGIAVGGWPFLAWGLLLCCTLFLSYVAISAAPLASLAAVLATVVWWAVSRRSSRGGAATSP